MLCGCGSTCSLAFVPQASCACFAPRSADFWSIAFDSIESDFLGRSASGDSFLSGLTKKVTLWVQVRVVEHRRSKKLFALKYIDKAQCSKQRAVANVIQERRLLEEVRLLGLGSGSHVTDAFGSGLLGFPVLPVLPN